MKTNRLEAFSDGVIAIILTIMVLAIPMPEKLDQAGQLALLSSVAVYFVSFVVVANFWVMHRAFFDRYETVEPRTNWLNIVFLFALSLVPLLTKLVLEHPESSLVVVGYGGVFLAVNVLYTFMVMSMTDLHDRDKRRKVAKDAWQLPAICLVLIAVASVSPRIATFLYVVMPLASMVRGLLRRERGTPARRAC